MSDPASWFLECLSKIDTTKLKFEHDSSSTEYDDDSSDGYCSGTEPWTGSCESCERSISNPNKKPKIEVGKGNDPHKQLHHAIRRHQGRSIIQLLNEGVKPCTTNRYKNCFFLAQEHTCRFILKRFLDVEPSGVNCQDRKGLTLLMHNYYAEVFDLLMNYNPDVNILNDDGENILFYILRKHFVAYAFQWKRLYELGLDVNLVHKGETVLGIATTQMFRPAVFEQLFEAGATLPTLNGYGDPIVTEAMQDDRLKTEWKIEYLETFIKHGVDVSVKDKKGRNAMYYLLEGHFEQVGKLKSDDDDDDDSDSDDDEEKKKGMYWLPKLEDMLITLLEHNCEVQGLELTFEKNENIGTYRYMIEKLDIISTFARHGPSFKFLKALVERGLYDWTKQREFFKGTTEPMSPLTAYLSHVCTLQSRFSSFGEILDMCKYFISIGVDPAHRSRDQNLRFKVIKLWKERQGTDILLVSKGLKHPDALFFVAIIASMDEIEYVLKEDPKHVSDFEELLRLFVSFWSYPPLVMGLLGIEFELNKGVRKLWTLPENPSYYKLLMKIGGAMPLKSKFYKSIKTVLEEIAEIDEDFQPVLDTFLKLDGGIPTLRSLSRAAFRATVKKTCPTGLDFSEYRVLCQGEMTPIPPEVVNYLEFKPSIVSNT